MDQFPLDLQVWIPWVCKKLFLIRHENLSGPDFTPRQLPGSRQPRLDDGPVFHPKRRSGSLSFVFERLLTSCTFGSLPANLLVRTTVLCGIFLVGLWASLTRPSRVLPRFVRVPPFHPPSLPPPPLVGLFTATPLYTPSFAPLLAPVCRHAYGGFFATYFFYTSHAENIGGKL